MIRADELSVEEIREEIEYLGNNFGLFSVSGAECEFVWSETDARICHLEVARDFRNQGVGTRILRAVMAELRDTEECPDSLLIELPPTDNQYAGATERLFEKCGFEISYFVTSGQYPQRMIRGERQL